MRECLAGRCGRFEVSFAGGMRLAAGGVRTRSESPSFGGVHPPPEEQTEKLEEAPDGEQKSWSSSPALLMVPLRQRKSLQTQAFDSPKERVKTSNCGFVFSEKVRTIKVVVHDDLLFHVWLSIGKGSLETVSSVQKALRKRLQ